MKSIDDYKRIFANYGGIMRTKELQKEKILYRTLQKLIEQEYVEKVRFGYYQWKDLDNYSEVGLIVRLFPDAIFCRETALRYYGYSDRIPAEWHLAVNKDSGKSRFKIDYPYVKPHFIEPDYLEIGLTTGEIDGYKVRIYDKERAICDCFRYRNKMDREIFNKAIQNYVFDSRKNIPRLLEYAEALKVKRIAKELIGVWL